MVGATRANWLILNYYHLQTNGSYVSEIANADFFILDHGAVDPDAEFHAFKQAVAGFIRTGEGTEILCRFPARTRLLLESIDAQLDISLICPIYAEQMQPNDVKSVSMVFASGYFDNPASYYGHTLLKLNYPTSTSGSRHAALDTALNYGADANDNPGNPLYILKGLFGGYTASYSQNNYFLHSYLYTSAQLRDTWEFELGLSRSELDFVLEHSWEMRSARFDYYFFNDNCAHRIARIIELATDRNLTETHGFWLQPIQVIRNLRGRDSGRSLIVEETFRPSLLSRFSNEYNLLPREQRKEFSRFVNAEQEQQEKLVSSRSSDTLMLALDYIDLDLAKSKLEEADVTLKTRSQARRATILNELFQRPAVENAVTGSEMPDLSPLNARKPSFLRVGMGLAEQEPFQLLQYRIANNDFLEPRALGQEVSHFTMGDVEIKIKDSAVSLNRLVLVELRSLSTSILPSDTGKVRSWGLAVDYKSRSNLCEDCKDFGFTTQAGKAVRTGSRSLLYGLGGARLHTRSGIEDEFLTMQTEAGAVLDVTENWKMHAFGRGYWGATSSERDWLWGVDVAFNPKSRFDIRMAVEKFDARTQLTASVAVFFD